MAAGVLAGLSVLAIFGAADRVAGWERSRIAKAEARARWQEVADVLTGSVDEAMRALDLTAGTIDRHRPEEARTAFWEMAPEVLEHVPSLVALGLVDEQARVTDVLPEGNNLHANDAIRHARLSRPLRTGQTLVGIVDLNAAWQIVNVRLAERSASVRVESQGQTVFERGQVKAPIAANGTIPVAGREYWIDVSAAEHSMPRYRALMAALALGLSLAVYWGTVTMRRRRELAAALDRTALERAREAEQERQRYRDFYLRVPVPCLSLRLGGGIEDANDAMLCVLGMPRDEVVGRPLTQFMNDESRARLPEILQALERGELGAFELAVLRKHGGVAILRCQASVSTATDVREVRILGQDVTEVETLRRQASEALALQTMGRFAGVISHEVRNPLGVASLVNDVLSHAINGRPDLVRLCEKQRDALRSVERILSDSLDFLRAPRPRQVAVDLPTLLRDAADAVSGSAVARNVALELGPDVQLEFLADPHKLRQVLVNLLENAVQACPRGTGRVRLWASRSPDHLELHVEDNGSGIPADRRHRVFEPFFTSKGHGTGLGLAVVKQVIEAHGGRVWFETEEGQGTHFHVLLPYRPAPLEATRQPQARAAHPLKLLVVEDDPDSREILLSALRDAGHQVAGAANADEALARIDQQPPDVVISDYQLGAASATGEAVVKAAKQRRPPIPAVLVTGISAPAGVPADATLYKPLAVSHLLRVIDTLTHK